MINDIIHSIRSIKSSYQIPISTELAFVEIWSDQKTARLVEEHRLFLQFFCKTPSIRLQPLEELRLEKFSGYRKVNSTCEVTAPLKAAINVGEDLKRQKTTLDRIDQRIEVLIRRQNQPTYSSRVPQSVQDSEKDTLLQLRVEKEAVQQIIENLQELEGTD